MKTTCLVALSALLFYAARTTNAAECGAAAGASCCGSAHSSASGHNHAAAAAAPADATASPPSALTGTARTVFDNYIQIQTVLAEDSLKNMASSARTLADVVRKDTTGAFSGQITRQAEAVAKAEDLAAAREAFKPLSGSLIQYLKTNKVPPGAYYEVYCAMAKASWLQTDKTVRNPYFGQSMLRCGTIKG